MSEKNPLTLHGLLAGLMPRDVTFQFLDQCMEGWNKTKQGGKVTFVTDQDLDHRSVLSGGPRMQKAAFILWLDRDLIDKTVMLPLPEGIPGPAHDPLRQIQCALLQLQEAGLLKDDSPLNLQPTLSLLHRELGRQMGSVHE